jgi:two-component system, OmpR family, phosphate regulon sensor histidine kinase PhoR
MSDPAETLARMNASQLDAVIGAVPEPVVALDRHLRVVALNPAARTLEPLSRLGEGFPMALRLPALAAAIERAMAWNDTEQVEFSEGDRIERWYRAHVMPVASGGGGAGIDLFLLTLHDLTPLRRVEEVRADFVANASHELRTPLAALSGFIDTLMGPARDDAAAREQFLAIMQAQARRMARLIDDLLSLSRIELSEHIEPDATAELQPLLRHVVDAMQTLARERGVEMRVTAPRQSLVVPGDRDELVRLFENLIENALKYAAAGKRVDIGVEQGRASESGKPEVVVTVRDYGPGIAPEHLGRLTERFYRVDVGLSRSEGGTGLGLALVKHIVNRHRGRLAIESTPGEGSTFTVHLPLAKATNRSISEPPRPQRARRHAGR